MCGPGEPMGGSGCSLSLPLHSSICSLAGCGITKLGRTARNGRGLIWFIWSVWSIWFNQTNETDQINKRDQPVLARHGPSARSQRHSKSNFTYHRCISSHTRKIECPGFSHIFFVPSRQEAQLLGRSTIHSTTYNREVLES